MAIELAKPKEWPKPWGVTDLRPWSETGHADRPIGEISYERSNASGSESALLLKILLTSQPLSIQVHPDDAFARSIGLPHGKTEAWHVLGALPGAAVALGLTHNVTPKQLRESVDDGSIADLVAWRMIAAGDTILVPAGTIHAIGAGLVIAEIQQRSDATFRVFDHGRNRQLHVDHAVAAARATPAGSQPQPSRLANGRTQLASNTHFVFERIELEPDTSWRLDASRETWLLVLCGSASLGGFEIAKGGAVFAEAERVDLRVGERGLVCLVAYTGHGGPIAQLLRRAEIQSTKASHFRNVTVSMATPIGAAR